MTAPDSGRFRLGNGMFYFYFNRYERIVGAKTYWSVTSMESQASQKELPAALAFRSRN